jgi:hypothetical protein
MHFRERKVKWNKENNLMRNIFDGKGMIKVLTNRTITKIWVFEGLPGIYFGQDFGNDR